MKASAALSSAYDHRSEQDESLVARSQEGDRKAFRVLVERYQDSVALTVTSMLGYRTAEVDDVVQDAFIRCYETLDRFRGDAKFSTYLKRIAVNASLDALRRRKRFWQRFVRSEQEDPVPAVAVSSVGEDYEAQERQRLVQAAIEALPPKHRVVVVLRMIEGYSTEETAKMLDLAYGTVLSRLSRGLEKMKARLGPLIGILDE